MQITALKSSALGAVWFAVAIGILFPLAFLLFPGIVAFKPELVLPSIWSAVFAYGVPAAVVGALLSRAITRGPIVQAFSLGALVVLATGLLAGPWLALWPIGPWSFARFSQDAIDASALHIFLNAVLLRGLPFAFGGFAALGLRAVASSWGWHER